MSTITVFPGGNIKILNVLKYSSRFHAVLLGLRYQGIISSDTFSFFFSSKRNGSGWTQKVIDESLPTTAPSAHSGFSKGRPCWFESGWTTIDLLPQSFSSSHKNSLTAFKFSSQILHQSFCAQTASLLIPPSPPSPLPPPDSSNLLLRWFNSRVLSSPIVRSMGFGRVSSQ